MTGLNSRIMVEDLAIKFTQQKSLGNLRKNMQHKNTKAKNYSCFIYLFRYMSSVDNIAYFSLLAPIPLLWYSVK